MRNARFWVWENGGWIKLTLRPGETLVWMHGGPHEEGYSYTVESWRHNVEAQIITSVSTTSSRDCDGPHLDHRMCGVDILGLHARFPWNGAPKDSGIVPTPDGRGVPCWGKVARSQQDAYAEAMNY